MKKLILSFVIVGVVIAAGIAYVLRPPAEATEPIEALPVATVDLAPTNPVGTATAGSSTASAGVESVREFSPAGVMTFEIVQSESVVRFSIDEILRGNPFTAIGTTDQVAGQIVVNFNDPSASQIGIIQVNARTLTTDSENRNRMIRNEILDTSAYEFITFTPTSIHGLPDSFILGEALAFEIAGDLTIRDVTRRVTFQVTAIIDEDGRLVGHAQTVVLRSDFDLVIPSVPSVAGVSNEVSLAIEFVALRP